MVMGRFTFQGIISHIFSQYVIFVLILMLSAYNGVSRSSLYVKNTKGMWTKSIGRGLFAGVDFSSGAFIAEFVGELVCYESFRTRASEGKGGYGIKVKSGLVLDCYKHAKSGHCFASMANSPLNAKVALCDNNGKSRLTVAVANCKIVVCQISLSVSLRTTTAVSKGTEFCYRYGKSYSKYC
jgi:hypothetical protein